MSSTTFSATASPVLRVARSSRASATVRERRQPVRLTRRGRVAIVLLVLAVATVAMAFGRATVQAGSSTQGAVVDYVTVAPGDTLWQIAQSATPGADPRATVDRIIELNGLSGASLQAGQRLAVPARG
jgi:LysM repeat protein